MAALPSPARSTGSRTSRPSSECLAEYGSRQEASERLSPICKRLTVPPGRTPEYPNATLGIRLGRIVVRVTVEEDGGDVASFNWRQLSKTMGVYGTYAHATLYSLEVPVSGPH